MSDDRVRSRCPRCGGSVRTLQVTGGGRCHHQCLRCAHHHVQAPAEAADAGRGQDRFSCLSMLPPTDRPIVEGLVLLMLGSGTLVGAIEIGTHGLVDLQRERGTPSTVLSGFAFPVFSWLVEQAPRHATHLVAIDQGAARVCFKVRRRRLSGPL